MATQTTRSMRALARTFTRSGGRNNNISVLSFFSSKASLISTAYHDSNGGLLMTRTQNVYPRYFSGIVNNTNETVTGDNFSTTNNDVYAVALISPDSDDGVKLNNLKFEEILQEAPGTYPRDFFSLSLTSIGDAAYRKQRSLMNHYSSNVKIHPWFILPRGSEIIVSFGCLRAVVTREKALLFDAHRPTNQQHAMRINKSLHCKNGFTFRDGQILFSTQGHKKNENNFELNMVEEIIKEVCTMYLRRVRLYEPIVNSLMVRAANEAFSPSGLHKLVPVKDSLQRFEMNCKGALNCITDLLSNDEDMISLLLTEKANAKAKNEVLPVESHEKVELLLEEYARQLKSVLLEIGYLLQRVQSKQDMMALQLDAYRNRMIRMNLYLSMGAISMGFGTAVAGFFGMNVINGVEDADGIFNIIVSSSCMVGLAFTAACYSYIDGSRTKRRTIENLEEIEIMNRALGDMPALDLSFEMMLSDPKPITREAFREKIIASDPESIRENEIEFLFDILDYNDDDLIDKKDFRIIS
eukprot:CAMPEP_0201686606 /NCGR_PEP_ID=MMETSP0578-20130828/987_1 /ASSEMBLY_ACC=CAM_ASM_000663 /TAXON_ID=267565 /ORGANISM="Skeletonema grethea, Strain CCMP 1804" /LENGTH=524 /DNA_ID=CAMNT_0048170677 /DNA_START=20 /DNA_END=1594 /DNA_ORIENTATION=-